MKVDRKGLKVTLARLSRVFLDVGLLKRQLSANGSDLFEAISHQLVAGTYNIQVSAVCRSGFFQLRQLRPVVRSLSTDSTKTLVQMFISNRLDHCNSLL